MGQQRFTTGQAPEIFFDQVEGELQVRGSSQAEVVIDASPASLRTDQQGDVLHIACESNCDVVVPVGAAIHIGSAHSHARLRMLESPVYIQVVHGSLFLRNVAAAQVETIHGELIARQVTGSLSAETVHGNAVVRDVQGNCLLQDVYGNMELREVTGEIRAAIQGNARLRLSSLGGSQYLIQVEGNVHCRLPVDASLTLDLTSEAEYLYVKLPGSSDLYRQEQRSFVLGEGAAEMVIKAGGSIYLSAKETGWGEDDEQASYSQTSSEIGEQIARQVETQIETQMETMNRQLSEQMANLAASLGQVGLSPEEKERIMRKTQERTERANAQAQEKMRRAQEKIERKLEEARRREEERARNAERWGPRSPRQPWKFDFPVPPPPPAPNDPVSEDERLMILRMLEQKKISLQEADELLSALEGKER